MSSPTENVDETAPLNGSSSSTPSSSDDMSSTNPGDFIFNEEGGDDTESEKTASILDLIETKDVFVSLSGADEIDDILQGDSLDDILKTPSSDDKGRWRSSKTAEEQERRKKLLRYSKRKLMMIFAVAAIVLVVGFVAVYHMMPETTFDNLKTINKVSFDQLRISPNLKDEKQLSMYYNMADKLMASGKTKDAQAIFRKLAATQWRKADIQVKLGECHEKVGDASGALKYYSKAVSLGYRGSPHPAILVATNQYKNAHYAKVILTLRIISKIFPKDENMAALLGSAYFKTGNLKKAFEFFNKTNPNRLSKKQMRAYAALIEKLGEKKKAFRIYLTLAKAYGDENAFIRAEKLAPDAATRTYLLSQLISKYKNTPRGALYTVQLAERMFFNENTKAALSLLSGLDPNLLDKEGAEKLLGMISRFRKAPILLNECHEMVEKYFSDDCLFQERLMRTLIEEGHYEFCREFFKQQYARYSKNALSNYMFALFQTSNTERMELYEKALALNPVFFKAAMALGKLYITNQQWAKARSQFFKCLRIVPNSMKAHYYLAIVDIKISDSPSAMTKYESFLKRTGIKEADRLRELVSLSQYMKTSKMTNAYLDQAARFPELAAFVQEQKIKTKFIYSTIKESDFSNPIPSRLKYYYQMYLISHGESMRMMMIPTRRKDFPEFWKVFICWRTGVKSWENSAKLLLKRDKSNKLISGIVKLWQKRISPQDASPLIDDLPYEDKPLMAIMVAEVYYREGRIYNSEIFFKQALHYSPPNIYIQLAEFLKKNK